MKIQFINFRVTQSNYSKNTNPIKQKKQISSKHPINFKGMEDIVDIFEKQESNFLSLKQAYENLIKKLKTKKWEELTPDEKEKQTEEIIDLNNQLTELNKILNSSSVENFEEDEKALVAYFNAMQNLGKQEGFNKIVGYEDIKDNLMNSFILKTMAKARTSQKVNVPNAFLLFGPTGCGKTTFAHALAEQTLSFVDEVNAGNTSPEEAMEAIRQKARIAKENYKNSKEKKRTIIVVNEADAISNTYSPVVNDFCEFVKDCASKYNCTLFLTTNYPFDIDKRILDKNITPQKIVLKPTDINVARKIIEEKLSQMNVSTQPAGEIAQFLFSNPEKFYSNSDIINIINKTLKLHKNPTAKDYIKIAKENVPPTISKKAWSESFAKINEMPQLEKCENLLQTDIKPIQALFPIGLSTEIENQIESIEQNLNNSIETTHSKQNSLDDYENETLENIAILEYYLKQDNKKSDILKTMSINGAPLADLWLKLSDTNIINGQNIELKNSWLDVVLKDKTKTDKLILETLNILKKENNSINKIKEAYFYIIKNDALASNEEKSILIQQQENKLFYDVVKHSINLNDPIQIDDKILSTLKILLEEKERAIINATENIFEPVQNYEILLSENPEDVANINCIFQILNQIATNGTKQQKEKLSTILDNFNFAKNSGSEKQLNKSWQELINIAQDYFETTMLDELTNRNIELLNSINQEKESIHDKTILKLLNNSNLTIEQKEFVTRYAKDNNFKNMLKNQNIDIASVIEELVFFEANNKNLINESNIDFSNNQFNKMMSDKFKQIDKNLKDINIQGDRLAIILNTINDNFSKYADESLKIQSLQLNELVNISQNTFEIKQNAKALTRIKLIELEKDEYYKDVVPKITKLLPKDDQIDIQEFLSKVDDLAKNEKDEKRKKKIIKVGTIIARTIAVGVGTYYFGPAIIEHLFSQTTLNPTIATSAITKAIEAGQLIRKLGNSNILKHPSFGHYSGNAETLQKEINRIVKDINNISNKSNPTSAEIEELYDLENKLKDHKKWRSDAMKKIQKKTNN